MEREDSFAGLQGLAPGDPQDSARLLGMIMALAGEVFVLKAEVERLKQAAQVSDTALEASSTSEKMAAWMNKEQREFGAALMRPFTHPDEVPDVSHMMKSK